MEVVEIRTRRERWRSFASPGESDFWTLEKDLEQRSPEPTNSIDKDVLVQYLFDLSG